jgi:hypothetical protein
VLINKSRANLSKALVAFLLLFAAACRFSPGGASDGANGEQPTTPAVVSNDPVDGATGVSPVEGVSASFSERMDPTTLTAYTFTLTSGATPVSVPGTVIYSDSTVVFSAAAPLASNALITATITTGANSASGVALATAHTWSFTTGTPPGNPVDLGTAGNYVILDKTTITAGASAAVTGDLGLSPGLAAAITGFALMADATGKFSTSHQVVGKVYAADYTTPTPTLLATAVSDMDAAFAAAVARVPDVTEVGSGDIGGRTIGPGVYQWTAGLQISENVTLTGSATDVWIFQAQSLTLTADMKIVLAGGALPKNVFWQVSGAVILGARSHVEGIILTSTSIAVDANTTINGRLLGRTGVTLGANSTVAKPVP